jgi:hypothetical protein
MQLTAPVLIWWQFCERGPHIHWRSFVGKVKVQYVWGNNLCCATSLTVAIHYLSCSGFIRGREGELPSLIAFKPNYTEGALLATVS